MTEQITDQLENDPNAQGADETILETSQVDLDGQPTDEKLLTQADFDKALKKRLEREAKKYADYEDLKAKASEYEQKLEQQRLAEMTEKERAEELATKYESEKEQLAKELEKLRNEVQSEKIKSKFNEVATSAGIAYLGDAFALADLTNVSVLENGEIVGIEDAINTLVDNKPFLVKQKPKAIGQPSNGPLVSDGKTADQLLKDAAEKARKTGRQEDRVAYAKLKRELTRRK